jgi:AraC-like DNA-binding protein
LLCRPDLRGDLPETPPGLIETPGEHALTTDTLSDVLRFVRLRSAVFYYLNCGAEWAAEAPPARDIAEAVMPGAEHVMEYHVMTKGAGWAAMLGQPPVRLAEGDVVVFPHGDPHVVSSAPGLRPSRSDWGAERDLVFATRSQPKPIPIVYHSTTEFSVGKADQQAFTNVVCGFLGCDLRPFNPLVATLPRLLHLPAGPDGKWIAPALQQAVEASQDRRPGSGVLLERLSEMVFVDAVRRYVESLPAQTRGWLAGLRDRYVGRALGLLHGDAARDWTIEELAGEVALSRSALHERFVELIGQPPMQYLTQWRMQLAAKLLRESKAPVAAIALEVGYDSEAAFSRAFKRVAGRPPAAWRRGLDAQRAPSAGAAQGALVGARDVVE